ncbi:Helix-hairpin-helix motif [Bifidobacterium eulemuris]|uniref:Helix-hairpin-helix domain-containing protein n=2 Tax=Bifidobacterium eulemuris TaxID=1765219 RepID=A0A261GD73_9BIFI|nr:ComEA family DNA-binding protein [Bifidobacterium eulemuris]OZG69085.1 Helix-hairpin-helix motif [Bifidobacterium eulemuris]QOL31391.1 helix-hairpin-helix domain-containing protein [Bifidobacterium eulemuris]
MLTAVLILTAALCASLTLLVQQGANMAALQDSTASQTIARLPDASTDAQDRQADESSDGSEDEATDSSPNGTSGTNSTDEPPTENQTPSESETPDSNPTDDGLIDLNTADAQELDTLPGVGPAIAQRILDHRASIGRFTSVDQLLDVKGIGMKTLDKMRAQVTVR